MSFHVGQLVVCVNSVPRGGYPDQIWPRTGVIYTVRELFWNDWHQENQIRLVEIINEPRIHHGVEGLFEGAFSVRRFRPITEQRLELFRSLLVPTRKEKVEA